MIQRKKKADVKMIILVIWKSGTEFRNGKLNKVQEDNYIFQNRAGQKLQ